MTGTSHNLHNNLTSLRLALSGKCSIEVGVTVVAFESSNIQVQPAYTVGRGKDLREGERERNLSVRIDAHTTYTRANTHRDIQPVHKKSTPLGLHPITKGTPHNILLL